MKEKLISNKLQRNFYTSKSKNKNRLEINQKIKSIKIIYKHYFANFIKEYGNTLIEKCNFPSKFKKFKLYCPHKSFINTTKNEENRKFLLFTIKNIFYYKKKKLNNKFQNKNKKIINNILFKLYKL